ncbi:P-loop NTPase fold protein [Amphritea sp.]|uniref:KAP family P-loop NTPase fold protein n=1 Tax=Amphritea sp. TaxID=1872502 RepID=UPI0025BAC467|nr:P-loop NTPase fold protein [Amphritea sp.]
MSKYHLEHAKYSKWLKSHTFENCKLDRKEYGHFIADYISGEKDGFVLNINGAWGSGKTEFLKRLYTLFINKRTPTIYINAWESDFSKDPLTVVTSELLEQLSLFNENIGEDLKTVKSLLGRVIKGSFYGAAGFTTHKLLGDATIGSDLAKELLNDESSIKFIDELKGSYLVQTSAISEIRIQLGQLAEVLGNTREAQLPVIVLVDELDRCRPDYAIEMLEVIKHFFHTKNFVFIIATDTKQLSNSMNAVYGNKFDSIKYLRRFFDREATLPKPDIEHYLDIKNFSLEEANSSPNITIAPGLVTDNAQTLQKYVSYFIRAYDLEIRDLDQILAKLESCLRSIISTGERDKSPQLIDFLCC